MDIMITLKNGLKFVVLSKITYENERYLCLSNVDNPTDIVFALAHDETKLTPVEDGELIIKLLEELQTSFK